MKVSSLIQVKGKILGVAAGYSRTVGWGFINLGFATVVFLGCSQEHPMPDPWYCPPTDLSKFRQVARLPKTHVAEVTEQRRGEAENQLHAVACVEISPGRATELTGQPMHSEEGTRLFLVRAVYLSRGTDGFRVIPLGSDLLIEHSSLGSTVLPMKRQPLVLRLSQKPTTVYVFCSMVRRR